MYSQCEYILATNCTGSSFRVREGKKPDGPVTDRLGKILLASILGLRTSPTLHLTDRGTCTRAPPAVFYHDVCSCALQRVLKYSPVVFPRALGPTYPHLHLIGRALGEYDKTVSMPSLPENVTVQYEKNPDGTKHCLCSDSPNDAILPR